MGSRLISEKNLRCRNYTAPAGRLQGNAHYFVLLIKFCTGGEIGEAWPGSTDYENFFEAQLYQA